ncbi:MAG: histidine kinase [Bacteroidota bacterium]
MKKTLRIQPLNIQQNWVWIVLVWIVISLLSTTMLYVRIEQDNTENSWGFIFVVKLAVWMFWGVWALVIYQLSLRFRLEKGNIGPALLFHIPFSIFSVLLNVYFYALVGWLISLDAFGGAGVLAIFSFLVWALFEWYFIFYWSIVLVSYVIDYFQKYKAKQIQTLQLQAQLVQSQLQALKMQLQPHFLFNTLNAIASQVRQDEKKSAVDMLTDLSELLRWTLAQRDQQVISLDEELSFIRRYLELESKRFPGRMDIEIEVAPNTLAARVPVFFLQPIVENALKHGLAKKLSARKLGINIQKVNETLSIIVNNEGPALSPGFDIQFSPGIGLSNTMERLAQLFGETFHFELNNVPEGVEARIQIPYHS